MNMFYNLILLSFEFTPFFHGTIKLLFWTFRCVRFKLFSCQFNFAIVRTLSRKLSNKSSGKQRRPAKEVKLLALRTLDLCESFDTEVTKNVAARVTFDCVVANFYANWASCHFFYDFLHFVNLKKIIKNK